MRRRQLERVMELGAKRHASSRRQNTPAPGKGVEASDYGSGPSPAGYHWEFVTSNGDSVTSNGVYVVALVEN
jgi:hypothetical protein